MPTHLSLVCQLKEICHKVPLKSEVTRVYVFELRRPTNVHFVIVTEPRLKIASGQKCMCLFQVLALKKIGMVGRHNILFCQNIFSIHFPPFSSKCDNILFTIHNKMFRVGAKA